MVLALRLDKNTQIPLYRRVSEALLDAIKEGRLPAGTELPSAQDLANSLDVSRDTVVKSYRELIGQGYLEAAKGSGTFVSKSVRQHSTRALLKQVTHSAVELPRELISHFGKRLMNTAVVESTSADLADLNYGSPPLEMLPSTKWRELLLKYCKLHEPGKLEYDSHVFGHLPLRQSIASYLVRAKGVSCTAEQVIVFDGSQNAFGHAARTLVDVGDTAVVENPGYVGARENLQAAGAILHAADLDHEGMLVSGLPTRAKLCYVTPTHHDPTGVTMSAHRRRQLMHWAREHCAFIVEDAWDGDYNYGVRPPMPLQSMAPGAVLYIYSFWKVLFPLVTIGVMVVPPRLIPLFERSKLLCERQFPMLEHLALFEFLSEGHFERHIRKTRKEYQSRRQALIYALSQRLRSGVLIPKQSAALHLHVQFRGPHDDEAILSAAQKARLPLVATSKFYAAAARHGEFLLPFASIDAEKAEDLVASFAGAFGL